MTRGGALPRWATWALVFAFFTADGALHFEYRYLDAVARAREVTPLAPLLEQMTGSWGSFLLFVPLAWFVRRWPLRQGTWLQQVPIYVAAMVGWSVAHTTLLWGSRALVWRALGLGPYDYGNMRVRYFMEGANDVVTFWVFVAVLMGVAAWRTARERALREAELRGELARAQVQALERRLHPHFLFNALNTISSVMYDDVAGADRMIAGLSELLRQALRSGEAQVVSLAEELQLLERYLAIMRARFSDRLTFAVDVEEQARTAMVPPLLLQPLVENAIRHGANPASHRVNAALCVRREGQSLRVEIRDDGRGLAEGSDAKEGVGLSTTVRRLTALYGDAHTFSLQNMAEGGLRVTIELPFQRAEPAGVRS